MHTPFQFRPDQIAQEAAGFARNLGESLTTLTKLGNLETGVTAREVVYQEDKLVLYRFRSPQAPASGSGVPLLIVYALVNRPYMRTCRKTARWCAGCSRPGSTST